MSATRPDADATPDERLQTTFWVLVAVFDLALILVSVGVMLVGFRGRWTLGFLLVGVGLAVFSVGYRAYRRVRAS